MRLASVALPALLVALLTPVENPVRTRGAEGFTVVVTSTPTGWAVECEKGCDWKASFTCEGGCPALVDSRGVVTLGEIRPPDPLFQFIVRRENQGFVALARSGTYWRELSWSCAMQPCRGRITESGITPLR